MCVIGWRAARICHLLLDWRRKMRHDTEPRQQLVFTVVRVLIRNWCIMPTTGFNV